MRSRSFFYASLGVLALTLAFHLGARSATAQSPGGTVSVGGGGGDNRQVFVAVTSDGSAFMWSPNQGGPWVPVAPVFGGPTPARQESFGAVKARYR